MPTLSSIQRLKPAITFVFVVGIIMFLILIIFLQSKRGTSSPPAKQYNASFGVLPYPEFIPKTLQHKVSSINVNLRRTPNIPNNIFKVYELKQVPDAIKIAQQLATNLNFTVEPVKDTRFVSWSQDSTSLSYDIGSSRLVYSKGFVPNPANTNITSDDAEKIAKGFIEKIPLSLKNYKTVVTLLKNDGSNFVSAENIDIADAFEFDFYETIDNYSVFGQSPRAGSVTMIIDKTGNLLKLETRLVDIDYNTFATYPLKSIELASQDVKNNGIVVETSVQEVDPLVGGILNIQSINLTNVQLAYFRNIREKFIIPIYVYEGSLILTDGRKGTATVYLPAIEDRYFQKTSQP